MSAERRKRLLVPVCLVPLMFTLLAALTVPAQAVHKLPPEKQWRKDVATALAGSHDYVAGATTDQTLTYAINVDIDNSSIATYYRPGSAIPAVLSFATDASSTYHVALLFNTARTGKPLSQASSMLARAGYAVTEVCGRTSRKESVIHGKQRCRAHFIAEGYTIIANVGNRDTDFSGPKNYGRAFRLPNYGNRLG